MLKDDAFVKTDALLYIESSINDEDLIFNNDFLPDTLAKKLTSANDINACFISVPKDYSGVLSNRPQCIRRDETDDLVFWKKLFKESGADHIVKIFCDSPFLDTAIIHDMLSAHVDYVAEFTYSENLPQGFTCEILSRKLVESVPETENTALSLVQTIRSNINQFDVELFYRQPDIRDKRLAFRSSVPRDRKVMENLLAADKTADSIPAYRDIEGLLNKHPEVMYAGPSYLEIELNSSCDENCIFCGRACVNRNGSMNISLFEKIMDDMKYFNLPYTVCFGGLGEPLMHENAAKFIKKAIDNPQVERLIIETNGIYIDETYISLAAANPQKLVTIININGFDRDTYKTIHGADKFEQAAETITSLREALNGHTSNLFVQIMKIKETEPFLDSYYDLWESKKVPIILQKQNTYLGKIKDRRYSDLSPLERTPCWHLERDMFILPDGTVGFCKQDIDGKNSHGNIKNMSLHEIYNARINDYINNRNKKYPASPDCASCDEWYTFNF